MSVRPQADQIASAYRWWFGPAMQEPPSGLPNPHVNLLFKNCAGGGLTTVPFVRGEQDKIYRLAASQNTYFHIALHSVAGRRGSCKTATCLPGLATDIDAVGPGREKNLSRLPPSVEAAEQLVRKFEKLYGVKIGAIIRSGYGLYPLIKFREPLWIERDAERELANSLLRRYGEAFDRLAKQHGWTNAVDKTTLASVLRLPGTLNLKGETPRVVEFVERDGEAVDSTDLDEVLPELPSKTVVEKALVRSTSGESLPMGFQSLYETSCRFRSAWAKEPIGLCDETLSGYEMALAHIMAREPGWSDQDIADALCVFRGKHDSKPKSSSSYATTIAKARQAASAHESRLQLLPPREDSPLVESVSVEPVSNTCLPRMNVADVPSVFEVAREQRIWTVDGMFAEGSLNMLSGESGSGKSIVCLSIAQAVSLGTPFAGRNTTKRPVLYLDHENPADEVAARLRMMSIAEGETFKIWGGWLRDEPPDPAGQIVGEYVRTCDPKPLIVVDTLVAFNPEVEKDSTASRSYMNKLRRLANCGATILAIHHTGKADTSKDYRGSSDLKAALDAGYVLTRVGHSSTPLEKVRIKPFKSRFCGTGEMALRFTRGAFLQHHESPNRSSTVRDTLRQLLIKNPGVQTEQFKSHAKDQGLPTKEAGKFLSDGRGDRSIKWERTGRAFKHWWVGGEENGDLPL